MFTASANHLASPSLAAFDLPWTIADTGRAI
jgi:hypothetical protein